MGKGVYLGEFEQVVLLALAALGEGAFGKKVFEEIVETTGREVSIAAVYVTLTRLESKGYISSSLSEATSARGGKPRKFFRLEPAGALALKQSRELIDRLWESAQAHPDLLKG